MRTLLLLLALAYIIRAKLDANQKLKVCCARQKTADKECKRRFCDLDSISQRDMFLFLNMCSPRGDTIKLIWDCASSRHDHRECCERKNVLPVCMTYCESSHAITADYFKQLVCLQNFDAIRSCFKEHLSSNANIYGDS